jgi:hypothetical protein
MSDDCDLLSIDPIKQGDTFQLNGIYKIDGVATSLTLYTITSQVRDAKDTLIESLTVTKDPVNTGYFTLSGGEIDWIIGTYYCDIHQLT